MGMHPVRLISAQIWPKNGQKQTSYQAIQAIQTSHQAKHATRYKSKLCMYGYKDVTRPSVGPHATNRGASSLHVKIHRRTCSGKKLWSTPVVGFTLALAKALVIK